MINLDKGCTVVHIVTMKNGAAVATVVRFLAEEEPNVTMTHEEFVHAVREVVAPRVLDKALRERLLAAKLVYGSGPQNVRGVTFYSAWHDGAEQDFIEITAVGEEGPVQLAGTTIHELAHCLAGWGAGHGSAWKAAAAALGLKDAMAAGQHYTPEDFEPSVWVAIENIPHPTDGTPLFRSRLGATPTKPRPCPSGIGTRGGRSRGAGSGSRLRLWVCSCAEGTPGRKVRVASDEWDATCNRCHQNYTRQES